MTEKWALTIWQPWATMIMEGWKPYEFRGWKAPDWLLDQDLVIHAGARPVRKTEVRDLLYKLERGGDIARQTGLIRQSDVMHFLEKLLAAPKSLPMSSVLGFVTVSRSLTGPDLARRLGLSEVNDSDREEHMNWGWPLSNIRPLRPMLPATGQQGLWIWKGGISQISAN